MKKMNCLLMMTTTSFLALFSADVRGDVTVSFSDVQVIAGSQATVIASISDTNNGLLSGYNLPVDFGANGFGTPAGLSFVSAMTLANPALSNFASPTTPSLPFNYDLVASDSGNPGAQLSAVPLNLFSLTFAIDNSVSVGTVFDIFVQETPAPQPTAIAFTINGVTTNGVDFVNNGSITVVGIPEPASGLVLLGCVFALATRRRR